MTWENMPWVVGLLAVALVIAFLNDRTKPRQKREKEKAERRAAGSTLGVWLGIGIVAVTGVLSATFGRDFPAIRWIIPLVFGGLFLLYFLFLIRNLIWAYLKFAVSGQPVIFPKSDEQGRLLIRCPGCGELVPLTPVATGETAFQCPHCGETGTWHTESK